MKKLSKYIDHTLLKADATASQIETLCQQAKQYDFASVCVNGGFVKKCSELLKDTDVKVCCVVGFPLGAMDSKSKADETRNCVANGAKEIDMATNVAPHNLGETIDAIKNGADEIDMVINISAAKDHNWQFVQDDIAAVVEAANGNTVKVIIETCLLTDEEKVEACKCAVRAKADFVKTSTGFSKAGATVEDVKLMRKTVGDCCQVKAAGGIRTYSDAIKMIEAGADRLGCSASIAIVEESEK